MSLFVVAQTWYGPRADRSLWREQLQERASPAAAAAATQSHTERGEGTSEERSEERHRAKKAPRRTNTQTMASRTTGRRRTLSDYGMPLLAPFLILFGLTGEFTVSLSLSLVLLLFEVTGRSCCCGEWWGFSEEKVLSH